MSLYTIICEYAGGTFVSQVEADSEADVPALWTTCLSCQDITTAVRSDLVEAFAKGEVEPLDGLRACWCMTAIGKRGLALVNIVRTA